MYNVSVQDQMREEECAMRRLQITLEVTRAYMLFGGVGSGNGWVGGRRLMMLIGSCLR